jgi:hypothetical protein
MFPYVWPEICLGKVIVLYQHGQKVPRFLLTCRRALPGKRDAARLQRSLVDPCGKTNASLFSAFPDVFVCPEPVLVN